METNHKWRNFSYTRFLESRTYVHLFPGAELGSDLLQKVLCIAILKRKQNNGLFIWVTRGLHDPHMKNDFKEINVLIGLWRRNSQMPFILRTLEGYKLKKKMVRKLKLRVQFDVPIF